ncbi:DUF982 domain-containing protein [Pseudaminobacter arsenicus]|uniref:DUF982 domain-containing protein n=2 Tax=Borborobacter arsenicus TaxID=1851146 RepID=A0A432UZA8_9HYPH|nr:DUF982 domain-containing protein [Pseudaminobacter arsenicus]
MTSLKFPAPVTVRANGALHDIVTVQEAMAFLNQWPKNRRGPAFGCAERSCNAAIAGQLSAEQARQSLASFARIAGILVTADALQPASATDR